MVQVGKSELPDILFLSVGEIIAGLTPGRDDQANLITISPPTNGSMGPRNPNDQCFES